MSHEDGWVKVERPEKETPPAGADESDPSLWVIFAKRIGLEKILVRFPSEPNYKYVNGSEMKISARFGGSEHSVHVLSPTDDLLGARKKTLESALFMREKLDAKGAELVYCHSGYWFMERLISTAEHSYILQTKNRGLDSEAHRIFVASFDLEKTK